jgi:hypothetical protein
MALGSRAAVADKLMVRPVRPQLRKCPVRPRSYAWCHKPTFRHKKGGHALQRFVTELADISNRLLITVALEARATALVPQSGKPNSNLLT